MVQDLSGGSFGNKDLSGKIPYAQWSLSTTNRSPLPAVARALPAADLAVAAAEALGARQGVGGVHCGGGG